MQFQTWTYHAVDSAYQHHQACFEVTVQCNLVHTVQRDVDETCNTPFYHH